MEPSDFQKLFSEFQIDELTSIDLRKSSFKKIGKLLEKMSTYKTGEGLIDFLENSVKGHKIITKVYRESLKDFVPQYGLRRIKRKAEETKTETISGGAFPRVKIEVVHQLGKHLSSINSGLQ